MPNIENCGNRSENEVMKGYVLYALKIIRENEPELQLRKHTTITSRGKI